MSRLPPFRFVPDEIPLTPPSYTTSVVSTPSLRPDIQWTKFQAFSSLCATAVGAGLVAIPRSFALANGYGPVLIVAMGTLVHLTMSWLAECASVSNKSGLGENVSFFLGKNAKYFFDLIFISLLFGAAVAMVGVVMSGCSRWESRVAVSGLVLAVQILVGDKVNKMSNLATVSLVCVIFFVFVLVAEAYNVEELVVPVEGPVSMNHALVTAVSVLSNCFVMNVFLCSVQCSLGLHVTRKLVGMSTWLFVVPVYLIVGIAGYMAFGPNVDSDVLEPVWTGVPEIFFKIAKLAIIATNLFRLPLVIGAVSSAIQPSASRWLGVLITVSVLMFANFFGDIGSILAWTGCTFAVLVQITFPALMFWKLQFLEDEQTELANRIMHYHQTLPGVEPVALSGGKFRLVKKFISLSLAVLSIIFIISGIVANSYTGHSRYSRILTY